MNSHTDTSIQPLDPPNDKWKKKWDSFKHKDEQAVRLYNALVREWNAWAKDDAAEKEINWIELIDRLRLMPDKRVDGFSKVVSKRALKQAGGPATVCWGYCIFASFF
jgi:hypothetical protein